MYGNKKRSQNEKLNFLFEYIFKKNIEFPNFVQLKRIKIATEVAVDKRRVNTYIWTADSF